MDADEIQQKQCQKPYTTRFTVAFGWPKLTNRHTLTNLDPALLGRVKTGLTQLHSQRILVNLFQKSGAECIAHLMDAADDLLGNFVQP